MTELAAGLQIENAGRFCQIDAVAEAKEFAKTASTPEQARFKPSKA